MEAEVMAARAAARLSRQVEQALAEVDLSVPQYRVLTILGEESAVAGLLARRLAVGPPRRTTGNGGGVARGWVERQADPDDRRRQVLVLTSDGNVALQTGDRAVAARLRALADRLDTRRADKAMAGLVHWNEALDIARDEKVGATQ